MCSEEICKAAHSKKKKKKKGNFRRFLSAKLKSVDIKCSSIKEELYILKEKMGGVYRKYSELEKGKEMRSELLICSTGIS